MARLSDDEDAAVDPQATAGDALEIERERRHWRHIRERRYVHFARAAAVGLLSGALAVCFQWSLFLSEGLRGAALRWLHHYPLWGWAVLPVIGAATGGLAGWLVSQYAPSAAGSGIPHIEAVLWGLRPLRWARILLVKFVGGVLGIGGGLSLGREGPTVQMGAAVGKGLSTWLRVPKRSENHLIASGAGAGLAAAFNAPLAGFIFVLEELQREFSSVTYATSLTAALTAVMVTRALTGQLPSFHVVGYPMPPLRALPLVVVLGGVCGLVGVLFNRTLVRSVREFAAWERVPPWARVAMVGAFAGLLAWWLPEAVGGGHSTAEKVLRGQYASAVFLLVLLVAKFALTMLSYGCGAPGGIFAPMLTLGAVLGLLVGKAGASLLPSIAGVPASLAPLGMAALFTATVRAPLTGVVLITEMTSSYEELYAAAVACLAAYLVAEQLRDKPVYEALLELDLHSRDADAPASEEPVLVDVVVEPRSEMDGRMVRDLNLPPGCLLVTVTRAGREIVPSGDTTLHHKDHLVVIVSGDAIHRIADLKSAARSR